MAEGQGQRLSSLNGRYRLCLPSRRKVKNPKLESRASASVAAFTTGPGKRSFLNFSPKFKFGKILRKYRRRHRVAPLPLPSNMDTIAEEDPSHPSLATPEGSTVDPESSVELQLHYEDLHVHTESAVLESSSILPVERNVAHEPQIDRQEVDSSAPDDGEVKYPLRFQRYKSLLPPELDSIPGSWGFLQKPVISASEGNLLRNVSEQKAGDDCKLAPVHISNSLHWDGKTTSSFDCHVPNERTYKILVIGDSSTGKTSIIRRLTHQCYSQYYRATVGVDFTSKTYRWDKETFIRVHFWDLAGQERFTNITRVYYREAVAAFLVFDVTRPSTFTSVQTWKEDLDSKIQLPDGSTIPCVLLANKCDQPWNKFAACYNLDEFCRQNEILGWFPTSALNNINVEESARFLLEKVVLMDPSVFSNRFSDSVKLDVDVKTKNKKSCC